MNKIIRIMLLSVCAIMLLAHFPIGAAEPYQTYTYSIDGVPLYSPAAYAPLMNVDSNYMGLSTPFDDPRDIFVDKDQRVYLSDGKNNRVIVMDKYYKVSFVISDFINDQGVPDKLTNPSGIFVNEDSIYVCDTDANRIVLFDHKGEFKKIIPKPVSKLFGSDAIYKPVSMVVDEYGRLYVISSTTYQGVIVMTENGDFTGFIGAQKVVYNILDIIWRRFQTEEQRKASIQNIPTEFNNITIDSNNLIYVTTSSIPESKQQSAITSKSPDYAPVKKLNANGDEVMKRNGFFAPNGEVYVTNRSTAQITGASRIIDVAVGPEGTWSIVDEKRQKVFTYDSNGNLLFAFGDLGSQLGNMTSVKAIAYQGDRILLLDKTADVITVYNRTEYGDILISALANENRNNYDIAVEYWTEILKRNSNFDAAYIGIGRSLYREANYREALKYYVSAYDTENYSDAFREIRKEWISKYILTIPIGAIIIIFLWTKFLKYARKVNARTAVKVGKRTFKEELIYGFHLIFHPFDGFWDLKHEKRGSVRASLIYIAVVVLSFFYQSIGQGYVLNPRNSYSTIVAQALSVIVPMLLWVIANWCLTTLFDGEGSFKDVFVAVSYSLVPLPLFIIPSTILSNFVTVDESQIIGFLVTIGFVWTGFLIFFGMMVTHDYTLGKNIITSLGTIVGMGFIMFVGILFTSLLSKMLSFVTQIVTEISFRI